MSWKKTWFSYLIWFLFTVTAVGILSLGVMGSFTAVEKTWYWYLVISEGFAGILMCVVLFQMGRRIRRKQEFRQQSVSFTWEGLAIVFFLAVGIFLRMGQAPVVEEANPFYETSLVLMGQGIVPTVHGITYVYQCLLRTVFSFFGNQWMAGVVLQCFLQFAAGLILYFAIRRAAGFFPSICVFAMFMVFPESVRMGMTYGTQMLFLCFYGAVLWGVFACLYKRYEKKPVTGWNIAGCLLLGFAMGVLAGLDLWAVTLLPFVIGVLFLETGKEPKKPQFLTMGILLLGSLIGFFLYLVGYGLLTGQGTGEVIHQFWQIYQGTGFAGFDLLTADFTYRILMLAGVLLLIAAFAYIVRKRTDVLSCFFFSFCVMAGMYVFQISSFTQNYKGMFLWMIPVIGAVGIRELLQPWQIEAGVSGVMEPDTVEETMAAYEKALEESEEETETMKKEKKSEEEQRPAYNTALLQDANEHMEKPKPVYSHPLLDNTEERGGSYINVTSQPVPIRTQAVPDRPNVISEDNISMDIIEEPLLFQPIGEPIIEQTEPEPVPEKEEPAPKHESKPVSFIENPLPVPKKHVKKTMDYDIEPDESKMFFDVWVSNMDDYDIKE